MGEIGPFLVPMTLFVSVAAVLIFRGPLGKAIGERIAGRSLDEGGARRTRKLSTVRSTSCGTAWARWRSGSISPSGCSRRADPAAHCRLTRSDGEWRISLFRWPGW
jgi:hypothetical protein